MPERQLRQVLQQTQQALGSLPGSCAVPCPTSPAASCPDLVPWFLQVKAHMSPPESLVDAMGRVRRMVSGGADETDDDDGILISHQVGLPFPPIALLFSSLSTCGDSFSPRLWMLRHFGSTSAPSFLASLCSEPTLLLRVPSLVCSLRAPFPCGLLPQSSLPVWVLPPAVWCSRLAAPLGPHQIHAFLLQVVSLKDPMSGQRMKVRRGRGRGLKKWWRVRSHMGRQGGVGGASNVGVCARTAEFGACHLTVHSRTAADGPQLNAPHAFQAQLLLTAALGSRSCCPLLLDVSNLSLFTTTTLTHPPALLPAPRVVLCRSPRASATPAGCSASTWTPF